MILVNLKILLCLVVLATHSCLVSNSKDVNAPDLIKRTATPDPKEWKPATFKGLTVGLSTRQELRRILGLPLSSFVSSEDLPKGAVPTDVNDEYNYSDGIVGKLIVSSSKKSGVISTIDIYPDNLSLDDLYAHYGRDFVVTHYKFVNCPNDAGASLVEESPAGEIESIEYRSQGIVIDADMSKKVVRSIGFVSGAIGVVNHKCE